MNNLLKKGEKWCWGTEEQEAFEKRKKQICKEPVLILMNSMVLTSGEVTGLSQDSASKQDTVDG